MTEGKASKQLFGTLFLIDVKISGNVVLYQDVYSLV